MSKLLIVDDSKDLLEAMEIILLQKGYEIKTISAGLHLFEEIDSFKPDLLILDIFLSGRDGREMCREIKNSALYKELCIMVFSASPKALEDYSAYGADGYLEKPFGISDLINKIEQILHECKQMHA